MRAALCKSPSLWQFNADLHLVGWLTEMGYEFDVVTDEDLHHEGLEAIEQYRVVITGSHPEYYSGQMLEAVHSYTQNGGCLIIWARMVSTGSSTTTRKTETSSKRGKATARRHGEPNRANTTCHSPASTAPSGGTAAAWMFDGIDLDEQLGNFGLVGDGAAGLELDIYDAELGTPPETMIAATSESHTDVYLELLEDQGFNQPGLSGTQSGRVRADITYRPTPHGGGVWSASSIVYCGSLSHNNYTNNISRLTKNVLDRFLSDQPTPPEYPHRNKARSSRSGPAFRSSVLDAVLCAPGHASGRRHVSRIHCSKCGLRAPQQRFREPIQLGERDGGSRDLLFSERVPRDGFCGAHGTLPSSLRKPLGTRCAGCTPPHRAPAALRPPEMEVRVGARGHLPGRPPQWAGSLSATRVRHPRCADVRGVCSTVAYGLQMRARAG
ncbi:N,N-dimethylformamidase beta subunit family domain-containing protein [Haloactinomyces albus]|uniref:N,N-dimethylformamidase beta subunit-like C-terminal domain-containing protein n=1 Tax=Haloactinomyces albus TaxID=1352928 RepID=A0AAE3ZJ88_9ACTN|nr:N,N-dimethylformamidase beta subunit family domain-containing protein [Haloactinomyces albus]MDR7304643.1 hypothetical protein [Haloactinomyces albus]